MINPKYALQMDYNYETFRKALTILANSINLTDEEADLYYLRCKAELYNMDFDNYKNDFSELEHKIDLIEKAPKESCRKSYYDKEKEFKNDRSKRV